MTSFLPSARIAAVWTHVVRALAWGMPAALSASLAFAALRPDLWLVQHVVFEGVRHASTEQLRHLADLPNGTLMWRAHAERVARDVERHPWVRSARVQRRWPATVVVEVEEYEPAGILHLGELFYVDAEGHPFLRATSDALDYPQITGISVDLERAHPELPRLATLNALWLLRTLDERGLVASRDVSEVAFSASRGFTVHAGAARLVFGLDGLERQVERLEWMLERGDIDLSHPSIVDFAPQSVAIVHPLRNHPPSLHFQGRSK